MANREIIFAANTGGGGGGAAYIEDVFSTYLYTGNGATQTINNGIDLAGEGGMVWIKSRSNSAVHNLYDTVRGIENVLSSNLTATAATFPGSGITSFNTNGFSLGPDYGSNNSGWTQVSWTFRKQPKFFDIVTWTGNGVNRLISHNLGSIPGMIIIKTVTGSADDWVVYHRDINISNYIRLNSTSGAINVPDVFNGISPTSTTFSIGTNANVNANNGTTYIAYLFAHDAGGFGASGTDNVISCGSFTTNGSGSATVNLGYEPQYVLIKNVQASEDWLLSDVMRGMPVSSADNYLRPNSSAAETSYNYIEPTATGFNIQGLNFNQTYIYMAIRRGPMATPTSGTEVYLGSLANPSVSIPTGFVPDMAIARTRTTNPNYIGSRLQGNSKTLQTNSTNTEGGFGWTFDGNTDTFSQASLGAPVINWIFARSPGFMDQVCYTGTGSVVTQTHNLGVVPELMLVKSRSDAFNWYVYNTTLGNTQYAELNQTRVPQTDPNVWNNTTPTSSVFTLGSNAGVNQAGSTYVAYLFATLAGVSKVGTYTGTGGTQTINAGLPTGARFVLIKRTDAAANWWVWDTARGMVSGTDPRLAIDTTTAESNNDWVYTVTNGFQIVTTDASVNASGGSYIYLAIA